MIVVIPTMVIKHLEPLLDSIGEIDLKPVEKIIIFNNSDNSYRFEHPKVKLINNGRNIGVNMCWNHGLKIAEVLNTDLMLLNDDVLFRPDFFYKTQEALSLTPTFAVVCPYTHKTKEDFELNVVPDAATRFGMMSKRNGWAFTINKRYIPSLPLIPKDMFVFFGDDWIWKYTRTLWIKDYENTVYHIVGKTLKKNKPLRALYAEDKRVYQREAKNK